MADDYGYDDNQDDAQQAMANADPSEVDAHRSVISEVLGQLEGQGVNTQELANQAGVDTTDANQMSPQNLINMAQTLAQQHPQIMQDVAQQFPEAQGLLNSVLGGGQGGGGILGGLMGRLFGG
jgi:hypothetical protein